jgi:hypothetical protein
MVICEAPTITPQPIRALQGLSAEQMRLIIPMYTHKSYNKQQQNHSHNIEKFLEGGRERKKNNILPVEERVGGYYNKNNENIRSWCIFLPITVNKNHVSI